MPIFVTLRKTDYPYQMEVLKIKKPYLEKHKISIGSNFIFMSREWSRVLHASTTAYGPPQYPGEDAPTSMFKSFTSVW